MVDTSGLRWLMPLWFAGGTAGAADLRGIDTTLRGIDTTSCIGMMIKSLNGTELQFVFWI